MFSQNVAFHFNNYCLWSTAIIGSLLIFKVFILNFFISQILAITIDNPYSYIDSIDDMDTRQNLVPSILAPTASIENLRVRICNLS